MTSRELTLGDKPLLQTWIDAEPDHAESSPEFYFQPNTTSILYSDDVGPVLAIRYSTAIRCDVEFNNAAGKERIRNILKEGFPEVAGQAKEQKFSEIVYNSTSKTLNAFTRLLGFRSTPDYRKVL